MAKALKTVGMIVGAAALIATGVGAVAFGSIAALSVAGVSTGALFLASTGLGLAAGLLQKGPSIPLSQSQRLTASVDPRAFRKTVFGSTAMATDVRYEEWSGADQDFCDWIVCLASHAIDGVDQIWLNNELAWTLAGGVQGKFIGYLEIPNVILEGSPANAFTFASGTWNGAHRLTGCAYLRMRFKVTGNGKKGESPFSGGPTSRMTIVGRGAKLYDPRRDSSVGGDGPMRANDQSTWRYTTDDGAVIGENLPLQILRVLLGWRITNPVTGEKRLATGIGLPAKRINLPSFMISAGIAEERVNRSAGGTEPRYYGAGVISEGDNPKSTLDALCVPCCGRFLDTAGRLSLAIAHNDLAEIATDEGLRTEDVVGPFTWDPDPALEDTPNVGRGRYVDPSPNSLYQLVDYPEVRFPSPDGIDRIMPLDLGLTESASQAQRVVKQILQRKQYQRTFSAPFDDRAWLWQVGKVVPFTFAPLGFVRRPFRVVEQEVGQGGVCNMVLREESDKIYAWDGDDRAPVQAAAAVGYDPTKNPLLQAIDESVGSVTRLLIANSYPVGLVISATDAGGSATISISAHQRVYQDRTVPIDAGTLYALDHSTTYWIYTDDVDRAGGVLTFKTTTTYADAFTSSVHPARHYIGSILTPAAGGGTSSGGGGTPPGGGGSNPIP
ncbi:hypothetical protein [Sphingomonas sp.]|jgi:hypothetical protein|uniref:hypothetical protein n=1 Tax=Sphingomonas sp. TaxID=28214 RepID=UPI0026356604|nr:hypothetical protein [Sphingomonas sp.]MDF2603504.1 hypothetical protein [Sphingomonas sp.]